MSVVVWHQIELGTSLRCTVLFQGRLRLLNEMTDTLIFSAHYKKQLNKVAKCVLSRRVDKADPVIFLPEVM